MKLVLIRGLAREAGHWGDFVRLLTEKIDQVNETSPPNNPLNQLQIFTPDCRGCGKYYREPAFNSISATTDHIRQQIIAEIGEPQSLILVGVSLGGMVAMDWAQRYPQELSALVTINTSNSNHYFWRRVKPAAWLPTLLSLLAPMHWREATMLKLVSNDTERYPQNIRFWQHIQKKRPVTRSTMIKQLLAAANFSLNTNTENKLPGLILASKADRLVSIRCSQALAKQMGWPLKEHENAGHDLPLDDPEWVINQIFNWLKTAFVYSSHKTVG